MAFGLHQYRLEGFCMVRSIKYLFQFGHGEAELKYGYQRPKEMSRLRKIRDVGLFALAVIVVIVLVPFVPLLTVWDRYRKLG